MKLPFRKILSCFTICMVEVEWGHSLTWTQCNCLLHFVLATQTNRLAAEGIQKMPSIQHRVLINFSEFARVFSVF